MTDELKLAITSICSMKNPSVANILRRNRYEYEAQQMERLITAWNAFVDSKGNSDTARY